MKERSPWSDSVRVQRNQLVSIKRAETLRLEKLAQTIRAQLKALEDLFEELLHEEGWREDLLNEELNKSGYVRNFDLINALKQEISDMKIQQDEVLQEIKKGNDLLDETRERILTAIDIETTRQYLLEVRQLIAKHAKR
jgi:hypothetical protein